MMMRIAFVAAALAFAGVSIAADAPATPSTLAAKNGNVTFQHKTHAAVKCDVCHGAAAPAKVELTKDTAHALCIECHKKETKGPQKCAECHKKA